MARVSPIEIAKDLKNISFPTGKQSIIEHAKQHGAQKDVLELLQQLPDREYHNMADVEREVGKLE